MDDSDLLQPRELYTRQGRGEEYGSLVAGLNADRRAFLEVVAALEPSIVQAMT